MGRIAKLYDEEIEIAVLGAAFIDMESASDVIARCTEDDFYRSDHKEVFRYIKNKVDHNEEPLITDIRPHMIVRLNEVYTSVTLDNNIKTLKKYSHKRMMRSICLQAIRDIDSDEMPIEDVISSVEKKLFSIGTFNEDIKHLYSFTESVIENYDNFSRTQYVTGINKIDNKLRLLSGMPFYFAGLPGGGKSSFIINMLIENSKNVPVGFFSQEMSGELCNYRAGFTAGSRMLEGLERYKSGIIKLKDRPIYIDETTGLTPYQLRSKTLRMVKKYGVKLIALDYVQLAEGNGNTIWEKETSISKTIKNLSKETDTCWIIISQMNKASYRAKKRDMSDLKGSGQFIQDARGIYFIEQNDDNQNLVDFWCAKQSYGMANWTEQIYFDRENNVFSELLPKSELWPDISKLY